MIGEAIKRIANRFAVSKHKSKQIKEEFLKTGERFDTEVNLEVAVKAAEQMQKIGAQARSAADALQEFAEALGLGTRKQANNWRKLHGKPMRRKAGRRTKC